MAGDLVEIQPSNSGQRTQFVGGTNAGKQSHEVKRSDELVFKQGSLTAVFQPPPMFQVGLVPRRECERNPTFGQRDLSSLRASAASTTRPAATSDSD